VIGSLPDYDHLFVEHPWLGGESAGLCPSKPGFEFRCHPCGIRKASSQSCSLAPEKSHFIERVHYMASCSLSQNQSIHFIKRNNPSTLIEWSHILN